MKIEALTLKKLPTAAGVIVIVVDGVASPSRAIAKEIGSTVPPVEIAMLAPK